MSRYRGYSDSIEVLIDVLDELRKITELLTPKEIVTPPKEVIKRERIPQSPKGKQHSTTSRKRSVDKRVG